MEREFVGKVPLTGVSEEPGIRACRRRSRRLQGWGRNCSNDVLLGNFRPTKRVSHGSMRQDVQTFIIQAACKLPPRSPDLVDVIVDKIFLSAMGYMNEPYWAVKEHCELITSGEG